MARNAVFLLSTEAIVRISALALAVLVARLVGTAGYGDYTYAIAFVSTFSAVADFGINRLTTRSVAARPMASPAVVATAWRAKVGLTIAAAAAAAPFAILQSPGVRLLILLLLIAVALQSAAGFWRSVFYGFERMEYDTVTRLLERAIALGGAFVALAAGHGLVGVAGAFIVAAIVDVVLVSTLAVRHLVRSLPTVRFGAVAQVVREASPLGLYGIVLALQSSVPFYVLMALNGPASAGTFGAAITPLVALIPLPVMVAGSALPRLSWLVVTNRRELRATYSVLFSAFSLVGFAAAPGLALIAPQLISLVYGPAFTSSAPVLRVMAIGLIGVFPTQVSINLLVALGRQRRILAIDLVVLVWQVTFDLIAIPCNGVLGAAWGTLSAELLVGALFLVAASREIGAPDSGALWRGLPACAGMLIVAATCLQLAGIFLAVLGGMLSYAGLLLLVRPLGPREVKTLGRLLRRADASVQLDSVGLAPADARPDDAAESV